VPLTTQPRLSLYEVSIPQLPFLDRHSVANVQGLVQSRLQRWAQDWQHLGGDNDKAEKRSGVRADRVSTSR
jgi:hypothetical protein